VASQQQPTATMQGHPARYCGGKQTVQQCQQTLLPNGGNMGSRDGPPSPTNTTMGIRGRQRGGKGWLCGVGVVGSQCRLSAQICQPPRRCPHAWSVAQLLVKHWSTQRQQKWVLLVWHAQQSSQTGATQDTPPHTQCCEGATGSPCADGMLKRQQQAAATLCTRSPLIHPSQAMPPTHRPTPVLPSAGPPTPPRPASSTSGHRAR
jgi:hypothetical protein